MFISKKCLINPLKVIFKASVFWDLAFQATTWLNQEIDQNIPSLCPCGKMNKEWLTKSNIIDHVENNGQSGFCDKYHFKDIDKKYNL